MMSSAYPLRRFGRCGLLAAAVLQAACGGDGSASSSTVVTGTVPTTGSTTATSTTSTGSTAVSTGSALLSLAASTAISLDTCGGSVAANVPAFYRDHFLCTDISLSGDGQSVVMHFQGLPPYASPYYSRTHPNYLSFAVDHAGQALCSSIAGMPGDGSGCYQQNPNTIAQHSTTLTIPLNPTLRAPGFSVNNYASQIDNSSGDVYDYTLGVVGVAANGVYLFSAFAAPGDDIHDEQYTFDSHYAHPQNSGYYHYHQWSSGPLLVMQKKGINDSATPGSLSAGGVEFYGIMCDGTLVFGATELDGSTPSNDLDAQGGHLHDIKDKNGIVHFSNRHHVHLSPAPIGSNAKAYQFVPELRYYASCFASGS